jgi:hypothetical protein
VLVTLGLGVVILVRRIAPMVRLRLRPRLARTG